MLLSPPYHFAFCLLTVVMGCVHLPNVSLHMPFSYPLNQPRTGNGICNQHHQHHHNLLILGPMSWLDYIQAHFQWVSGLLSRLFQFTAAMDT